MVINGATNTRIWGKAQENYSWVVFVLGASVLLYPPAFSVPSQTPSIFTFNKSIMPIIAFFYNTFLQSPQVSPAHLYFSSLFIPPFTRGGRKELQFGQASKVLFSVVCKFRLHQHCNHLLSMDCQQSELQPLVRLQRAWLLRDNPVT